MKLRIIQVINLLTDCLLVKSYNISVLSTPTGGVGKRPTEYSYDFSLIRISVSLVRALTR